MVRLYLDFSATPFKVKIANGRALVRYSKDTKVSGSRGVGGFGGGLGTAQT
jgi:hypothetical protein